MDEATYIKDRIDDQYRWYDNKSQVSQRKYKRSKLLTIILSILIPLLTGFIRDDLSWLKYVVGVAGAIVAITEGWLSINKYQEQWVEYRSTAAALLREKLLFQTKAGAYKNTSTPFQDFVANAEAIMAGENANWQAYISKQEEEEKKEEGEEEQAVQPDEPAQEA